MSRLVTEAEEVKGEGFFLGGVVRKGDEGDAGG